MFKVIIESKELEFKTKAEAKKALSSMFAGQVRCFAPNKWSGKWDRMHVYDSFSDLRTALVLRV